MRGALLHNTGDETLEIVDDLTVAAPGPGQVKIQIEATRACHPDLHAMNGSLPQPAPVVPCHHRAGAIPAFNSMNLFLHYMQMIMPGSSYWNIGIGRDPGEVLKAMFLLNGLPE